MRKQCSERKEISPCRVSFHLLPKMSKILILLSVFGIGAQEFMGKVELEADGFMLNFPLFPVIAKTIPDPRSAYQETVSEIS
jgi:hypothetical protein